MCCNDHIMLCRDIRDGVGWAQHWIMTFWKLGTGQYCNETYNLSEFRYRPMLQDLRILFMADFAMLVTGKLYGPCPTHSADKDI
jgi:hypothetical protein